MNCLSSRPGVLAGVLAPVMPVLACLALAPHAAAQTTDEGGGANAFHPYLSDRFHIELGLFIPDKDINLRVDGSLPGENIDFEDQVGASESENTGAVDFRWQFGKKWNFAAQAWRVNSGGRWELDENLEWEDIVLKEGTFAEVGLDLDVVRAFFGRRVWQRPGQEFGLGLGLHWLELGAFIQGQALLNVGGSDGETEFRRESVSAGAPLPNIGAWYMVSWSPRWVFQARTDWFSASIDEYAGSLTNVSAGVNYQPFEHVGFGLAYNYFRIDVDVDKTDWRGRVKSAQNGPFLSMTFSW